MPYRVRFDESGPDGNLRGSGFLRYAHDLAWVHSERAGFGREWYGERRLTWLVRAFELDLLEDVVYGDTLTVSTEVLGFRRAWARRRSQFTRTDHERVLATVLVDWMLLDGRGVPVRIPGEILTAFPSASRTPLPPLRVALPGTPDDAFASQFAVRLSELDPMGHVNNAAYVDYIDAHLHEAGRSADASRVPRRYRLEFVGSAEPGKGLVGRGWADDSAWCYRLTEAGGRELLRARVEADLGDWVGG
jgi:acyl-ACP thioesterase